jgi:beta-glucosidase
VIPADELTVDEQVALLAGADMWHTVAIERAGVPALRMSDGPNGVRGTRFTGPASACFPCGVSLAASFDPALVEEVGRALGDEARAKGARLLLAPTVNLHRTPIGGRNFECYSEDPHLTARMAVAYIRGVQSRGVGCCVKHFVANDTEHERMTISSEVDERTLRELYLVPFEAAVHDAGVRSVMSSYNRINGTYAADHRRLLTDLLRDEWGFDGAVVSDWFGLHSTAPAVHAGLDIEMPGPGRHRRDKLHAAIADGEVDRDDVSNAAQRVLDLLAWAQAESDREPGDETTRNDPQTRALIRRAGAAGTVLLRNEGGLLPLDPATCGRVAVIGPNAVPGTQHGGGSAALRPEHRVAPLDGIRDRAPAAVHEMGCLTHRALPTLDDRVAGELRVTYVDAQGATLGGETMERARLLWLGEPMPGLPAQGFATRIDATIDVQTAGTWTFALSSIGPARLFVDDRCVVDNSEPTPGGTLLGLGSTEVTGTVDLAEGQTVSVRVELPPSERPGGGVTVGCLPPVPDDLLGRAVAAARAADVAILVVGTDEEWESEGHDRPHMDLPGAQDELVRAVLAAQPRTVVVVNAASPVTMDWADDAAVLLQVWFPGQELGDALADVLFGDTEPGGRLPVTIPRRLTDTPAYLNHPGDAGATHYAERLYIGYRWYDAREIEPRFPFGHGLGYTTWSYGTPQLVSADGSWTVTVPVTNTGTRPGKEVVQLYAAPPSGDLRRPVQHLAAFAAVAADPGHTVEATLQFDQRALRVWDPRKAGWTVPAGDYELRIARSSRDVITTTSVTIS